MGVLESPSEGIHTLLVKGASHHAWTHPSNSLDQIPVKKARNEIQKMVTYFLNDQTCIENNQLQII